MEEKYPPDNEFTEEPILLEFLCSFVLNGNDMKVILAKTAISFIPLLSFSSKRPKTCHFT